MPIPLAFLQSLGAMLPGAGMGAGAGAGMGAGAGAFPSALGLGGLAKGAALGTGGMNALGAEGMAAMAPGADAAMPLAAAAPAEMEQYAGDEAAAPGNRYKGVLNFLKGLKFNYRSGGGRGFSFQGGGEEEERDELIQQLMKILAGMQVAPSGGDSGNAVEYVGGTGKRDASTPMTSGLNLNQPTGSLSRFFR